MVKDILWLGFREVLFKSDNEPAFLKLFEHVVRHGAKIGCKDGPASPRASKRLRPSGNGEVEAIAKQFQVILRTNKKDLEKRMGAKFLVVHPFFI